MSKKGKTEPRENVAVKHAPRRPRKKRTALTPITLSHPSSGSARIKRSRPGGKKAGATAGGSAHANAVPVAGLSQGEFRDIGELTFGKRGGAETTTHAGAFIPKSATTTADRVRVPAVTQSPWRKICDLLITAADGTLHSGTGWFISPRTLVTAGHCVFVFKPGAPEHGLVRSILVMPARDGETSAEQSPFGWAEVPRENLRVHTRWADDGELDFDYGAIILPASVSPIGATVGFLGFKTFLDQELDGSAPVLSGYPDDVPEGTQWMERNLIRQLTPTRVFYDIFTFGGQSGSPVFFRDTNFACAIHNFGDVTLNSGVRINPQVATQLNEWKA